MGLPGAGKSTIGRKLAARTGRQFLDLDHVIESRLGCAISEFFASHGEPAFRNAEAKALREVVSDIPAPVIATGGGAVLAAENRLLLRTNCWVVYLRADTARLAHRVANNTARPMFREGDPLAIMQALEQVRQPLYVEVAHHTIDTRDRKVADIVESLVCAFHACHAPAGASIPPEPA